MHEPIMLVVDRFSSGDQHRPPAVLTKFITLSNTAFSDVKTNRIKNVNELAIM